MNGALDSQGVPDIVRDPAGGRVPETALKPGWETATRKRRPL